MNHIYQLKGLESVHDSTLGNEITDNLIEFLNWGLLEKGNYFNVSLGESDFNDIDRSKLIPQDSGVSTSVWSAYKSNWVWETGVSYDPEPTYVSGIYVDDTFYDSNTSGIYSHNIDYYNGNLVFDSGIDSTSKVQVEHSHKWINVDYVDGEGMKEFLSGKHNAEGLADYLPIVAVEVTTRPGNQGYQLGGGQIFKAIVLFHCVADNDTLKTRLVDILSFQNDKTVVMFDSNKISASGDYPTDHNGFVSPDSKNYVDLVKNYRQYTLRLSNMSAFDMEINNNNIFGATVKFDAEVVKVDI